MCSKAEYAGGSIGYYVQCELNIKPLNMSKLVPITTVDDKYEGGMMGQPAEYINSTVHLLK